MLYINHQSSIIRHSHYYILVTLVTCSLAMG
jgi:hypothetical protein